MRYFLPVLRLASELPPQESPADKLGGLPWGLPSNMWPTCSCCGKSQSLLAQFIHDPERLDLGRPGRILNVFQCNHDPGMCPTWEGGSGSNACFASEPEELIGKLAELPPDSPHIEREARITSWIKKDDGISEEHSACFFSEKLILGLPEGLVEKVSDLTKLGGLPCWIQSPDEAPKDGWYFIGQLDSFYSFLVEPNTKTSDIFLDEEHWENRSHYCEGPNFGDSGIAYLFLRNGTNIPDGWFFWQCG